MDSLLCYVVFCPGWPAHICYLVCDYRVQWCVQLFLSATFFYSRQLDLISRVASLTAQLNSANVGILSILSCCHCSILLCCPVTDQPLWLGTSPGLQGDLQKLRDSKNAFVAATSKILVPYSLDQLIDKGACALITISTVVNTLSRLMAHRSMT